MMDNLKNWGYKKRQLLRKKPFGNALYEEEKKFDTKDEVVKGFIDELNSILPAINISYNELVKYEQDDNSNVKWSGSIGSGVDESKLNWFMNMQSGFYIEASAMRIGTKEAEALYKLSNWFENKWTKDINEKLRSNEI